MTVFVLHVDAFYTDRFGDNSILGTYSSIDNAKAAFQNLYPDSAEFTYWVDTSGGCSILYDREYNSEYGVFIDAMPMDEMFC